MDNETQTELESDIVKICKKYGITNAVFGGSWSNKFIGFSSIPRRDFRDDLESSLNAARLYQGCREKVYDILDRVAAEKIM